MNMLKRKTIQSFVSILIPVLFAYLGFISGKQLVIAYYDGAFIKWVPIEAPPAQATRILSITYEGPTVVVETDGDTTYQGLLSSCQIGDSACWVKTTETSFNQESGSYIGPQCQSSFTAIESLPQPVAQCASLTVEGADVFDEIHVALLADNSIQYWRFRGGELSLPFLNLGFLFAGLTFILGLGLGVLVVLVLRQHVFKRA